MINVRNFDHNSDSAWLHMLWHRALHPMWSMNTADLWQRTSSLKTTLVAELDGLPVGFCAASYQPFGGAVLQVILVDPARHRMGVGTALIDNLVGILEKHEVRSLSLGYEGSSEYFWPGVPESQHEAWNFFEKHGWKPKDRNFDLLIDLAAYQTPAWVTARLRTTGATLQVAGPDSAIAIIEFERRSFPKWASFFESTFQLQKYANVVFAKATDGAVIGAVLINANEPVFWSGALGARCGSFAVLGVAKEMEGRGVGTALAARSAEIVKERGCSACYINWTGLVTWYAKLSATVWSQYLTGTTRHLVKREGPVPTLMVAHPPIELQRA